jgi:hypothetical protein
MNQNQKIILLATAIVFALSGLRLLAPTVDYTFLFTLWIFILVLARIMVLIASHPLPSPQTEERALDACRALSAATKDASSPFVRSGEPAR